MQAHENRRLANATALALTCFLYAQLSHWLSIPLISVFLFNLLSSLHPSTVPPTFQPTYSPVKVSRGLGPPVLSPTAADRAQPTTPASGKDFQRTGAKISSPSPDRRFRSPQGQVVAVSSTANSKSSSMPTTPFQRSQSGGGFPATSPRTPVVVTSAAAAVNGKIAAKATISTPSPSKMQQWISKSESNSPTARPMQPQTAKEIRKMVGEEVRRQQSIYHQQQQQQQVQQQQQQATGTAPSQAQQQWPAALSAATAQLKTFQPASKSPVHRRFIGSQSAPPTPGTIGVGRAVGAGSGGINLITRSFDEFMTVYAFDDAALLKSARLFRQWFQEKIIGPLLDRYSLATAQLAALQQQQQSAQQPQQTTQPSFSLFGAGSAFNNNNNAAQQQQRFEQQKNLQQLLTDVESFLTVDRLPASKEYVLNRLQQLRSSPELGAYDWNHGSAFQGRPFNANIYPTDAEILFHLFCRYLDFKISQLGPHRSARPFTAAYVVFGAPETHHGITDNLTLSVSPSSNLRLFVPSLDHQYAGELQVSLLLNRTVYDVYHGRSNLFYALLSFLVYWNQKSAGWIEMLSLAGDLEISSILPLNETDAGQQQSGSKEE